MFRYETIISRRLQARTLCNQKTETKIGCNVLNRMATLGSMPASAEQPQQYRRGAVDGRIG
jgi:hypothetical protein